MQDLHLQVRILRQNQLALQTLHQVQKIVVVQLIGSLLILRQPLKPIVIAQGVVPLFRSLGIVHPLWLGMIIDLPPNDH